MNKIDKLTEVIRLAIPELMELKKGCLITVKEYPNEIIEILSNQYPSKCNACSLDGKYIIIDFDDAWGSHNTATYDKTIGAYPMLHNVLHFFVESLYSTSKEDKHLSVLDMILSEWDYSKMYLKDQSESTINYLFDLAGCT
jgi:hypothetical protein